MLETPLALLPLSCSRQEITDWFELYVLASEHYAVSFRELARTWDKRKNSEDSDFEGITGDIQYNLDVICQEIQDRMDRLGDCYPFTFSDNEEELIFLYGNLNEGSIIYLFCLFLSQTNNDAIFDDPSFYVVDNRVRLLFQACATWAAAGLVQGHSYSFGSPRHDHSGFLEKLEIIYRHFGDGKVVQSPAPGVSKSPKDEEIDVISWHPRSDSAPGTYYILGQVASGNNWLDKSIKGAAIEAFHETWFGPQPASIPIAAMFIPFNIAPIKDETIAERMGVLTRRFGHIYHRLIIPSLANKGLELARHHRNLVIERSDDIVEISNWLEKVISDFRGACVYS